MEDTSANVGRETFSHVQTLRESISKEELVLIVGEEVSILRDVDRPEAAGGNTDYVGAQLDHWWSRLPADLDSHAALEELQEQEEQFVKALPNRQLREVGILKRLGQFPLVLTSNPDCLLDSLSSNGGKASQKLRLDQVEPLVEAWPHKVRHNLLIKMFGDSCYTTRIHGKAQEWVESLLEAQENTNPSFVFLRHVFAERHVLFIGCNMSVPFYEKLAARFATNSTINHFSYEPGKPSLIKEGKLIKIQMDMPVWEFLSYLSPGSTETTFQRGQSWERFYLSSQRENYLTQQLVLEKQASAITYITASITNALATDELLEKVSRKKLANIFERDPFGIGQEEKAQLVSQAYKAMINRRDNLIKLIREEQTQIVSLFFFDEFDRELMTGPDNQRKMMVRKYGQALLLCNSFLKSASPFHLRVLPKMATDELDEMKKDAFAYIELHGGEDKAICYADTAGADRNRHQVQIIALNNNETGNRKRIVDLRLARAWDSQTSFEKVLSVTMQVDRELNALDAKVREKLQQLDSLQVLTTDHNIDINSLKKLGQGNFGEVYKGLYNGEEVAYKVMSDGASEANLKDFIREFETLQQCNHENVVAVKHCFRIGTRFGLAMEFIDGCNLRKIIDDEGAQSAEFTKLAALSIGKALAHLHQINIIHRDVKPDNVLVTKDRLTVKLGDFGLARAFDSTLESKTSLKGAWRYMAPEVMVSRKYTTKADVFSYGCVLVELITGKVAMHEIVNHKDAGIAKLRNVKPTIPVGSAARYGRAVVNAIQLCFEAERIRPDIQHVLSAIKEDGDVRPTEGEAAGPLVEIVCLGTGQGTTAVLHSKPSSSFVVLYKSQPAILVDLGAGVARSFLDEFGEGLLNFPPYVFITHNHYDHAGELPVVLSMRQKARSKLPDLPKPVILAGMDIEKKLKTYRLDEVASYASADDLARWMFLPEGQKIILNEFPPLKLSVHRSWHSETCYGFVLYHKKEPIFAYSGDSAFEDQLYRTIFQAPVVLLDGRLAKAASAEHATFDEIEQYVSIHKRECQRVYITGYGVFEEDVVDDERVPLGCSLLHPHDRCRLYPLQGSDGVRPKEDSVKESALSSQRVPSTETVVGQSSTGLDQPYPPPEEIIASLSEGSGKKCT